METLEALSALDAKRQAEMRIAKAAVCPPWRHAVFGLMMGGLIASAALDTVAHYAVLAAILCMIPVIINSDRKRTGMFINGYRRGKTRWVVAGIMLLELSLDALAIYFVFDRGDHLTPFLLAVVGTVVGVIGSIIWQRVFVREMGL